MEPGLFVGRGRFVAVGQIWRHHRDVSRGVEILALDLSDGIALVRDVPVADDPGVYQLPLMVFRFWVLERGVAA